MRRSVGYDWPTNLVSIVVSIAIVLAVLNAYSFAQISFPHPDSSQPISISAASAATWQQGRAEVWVLGGGCQIVQGDTRASARNAVVWIDRGDVLGNQPADVVVYLEDEVTVEKNVPNMPPAHLTEKTYLMRMSTAAKVDISVPNVSGAPGQMPAIYTRGMARRNPNPNSQNAVRRTQYLQPLGQENQATFGQSASGVRRIRINSRSSVPFQTQYDPALNLVVITSGVNVVIDNVGSGLELDTIDVSADRVVVWTDVWQGELQQGEHVQSGDQKLELYMEGNIVFRFGEMVIYANRMYYDVPNQVGIVLDAEVLTPVPEYQGLLRLKSSVLHQTGEGRYFAENSFLTSSRMGKPGYRIEMGDVNFEDIQRPMVNPFTGQTVVNPETGQAVIEHKYMATGRNSLIYLGDVPVFYWPRMATDLKDPTFYISGLQFKNDRVFGNQILTTWNVYQLLGVSNRPVGTGWEMSVDWLSERGLAAGTSFDYQRDGFFMIPGRTAGLADFWGLHDSGLDNLGRGRRTVVPETRDRYRLLWKHRQMLGDYRFTAEVGKISDRDFLEQYFENEWDDQKDESTGVELKRRYDNISWSVTADYRLDNFFTTTEWLPRLDHFWLGQSLWDDTFTWFEHSQAGYGRMRRLSAPTTEEDRRVFSYLPWETYGLPTDTFSRNGERLVTRQEIDWPIQMGVVKTVPYALGELAHWGEDLEGEDMQRCYWQAGIRASMPMWKVNPNIDSNLWNVHGIAHKVVFDVDFSVAESNRNLDDLPLYDAIDDDSIEAFRRMMPYHTFGDSYLMPWQSIPISNIPAQFDARHYALRTGMAGWVTSPSAEIAGDMATMRMGMRHRWQTKRGMPGRRHIIDWMVLDTNATWYPDKDRDNFGEPFGLVDYDFRWHVGDRLTLLSSGLFDFFTEGQELVTVGAQLTRPPRGSLYMGLRLLEGPIENHVMMFSYSYRMSPKWISTFSTSFDMGKYGNLGQNFTITRIGESLLVRAGFNVNASTNDVGVMFAIEPRFLKGALGRAGGARIPPAGLYGLE